MEEVNVINEGTIAFLDMKMSDLQGVLLGQDASVPVVIGREDVFPALEKLLIGKKVGDEFSASFEPEQAFGEFEPELIRKIPASLLGPHVEVGMKLEGVPGEKSDGNIYVVEHIDDKDAIINGNHPLSGMGLKFDIKVVKVEKATPEKIAALENFFEVSDLTRADIQ